MSSDNTLIIERLARVEEKIDNLLVRALDQSGRMDDHENRIRSLEGGTARLLGIGSVLAFVAGIAGPKLVDLIA